MFKLDLEKAEEPKTKLPTSTGSLKEQESSRKNIYCFTDNTKAFDCVDHNKLWNIFKEMGIPDHLTCLQRKILEWVAIFFSNACMHAKSLQSCPTLCDPVDSSPPGSSVHGIL